MSTKEATRKHNETKQGYQEKMEARLREWQAKIDALKAKAGQVKAEQKTRYHEEIDKLQAKQRELRSKLDTLKTSGENAWQELKTGIEMAWQELESSVKHSMDKFK